MAYWGGDGPPLVPPPSSSYHQLHNDVSLNLYTLLLLAQKLTLLLAQQPTALLSSPSSSSSTLSLSPCTNTSSPAQLITQTLTNIALIVPYLSFTQHTLEQSFAHQRQPSSCNNNNSTATTSTSPPTTAQTTAAAQASLSSTFSSTIPSSSSSQHTTTNSHPAPRYSIRLIHDTITTYTTHHNTRKRNTVQTHIHKNNITPILSPPSSPRSSQTTSALTSFNVYTELVSPSALPAPPTPKLQAAVIEEDNECTDNKNEQHEQMHQQQTEQQHSNSPTINPTQSLPSSPSSPSSSPSLSPSCSPRNCCSNDSPTCCDSDESSSIVNDLMPSSTSLANLTPNSIAGSGSNTDPFQLTDDTAQAQQLDDQDTWTTVTKHKKNKHKKKQHAQQQTESTTNNDSNITELTDKSSSSTNEQSISLSLTAYDQPCSTSSNVADTILSDTYTSAALNPFIYAGDVNDGLVISTDEDCNEQQISSPHHTITNSSSHRECITTEEASQHQSASTNNVTNTHIHPPMSATASNPPITVDQSPYPGVKSSIDLFSWIVKNRHSDCIRYMQRVYKAWYQDGKSLTICVCSRYPHATETEMCMACIAALHHTVCPSARALYDTWYRPLYTQKDKYELLKMLVSDVEEYQYDALSVDQILAVWTPWISEMNISETLSKQQKKDWKKRENKMKALLAAIAEKHALRKE